MPTLPPPLLPPRPPHLPAIIISHLMRFKHQRQLYRVLINGRRCVYIAFLGLCIIAICDAVFYWPLIVRNILSIGLWSYCLYIFIHDIIYPLLCRESLHAYAAEYEQFLPLHMKDALTSSVSFATDAHSTLSKWMMQRSIAQSAQLLQELDQQSPPSLFAFRRMLLWLVAIIPIALMLILTPITGTYIQRACAPWSNIPRHSDVTFSVLPEEMHVSRGSNILINVHGTPLQDQLEAIILWDDGHSETRNCTPELTSGTASGHFHLDLGPIIQSCSVHFKNGEAESKRYLINLNRTPVVTTVHLEIHPPQYRIQQNSQQGPIRIDGGDAQIIEGSQIRFHAHISDIHLQRARLIADNNWQQELDIRHLDSDGDNYHISGSWQGTDSLHYQLEIFDQGGIRTLYPQQWSLSTLHDHSPRSELSHSYGQLIHPQEVLEIHLESNDDTGIESITYSLHGVIHNDLAIDNQRQLLHSGVVRLNHSYSNSNNANDTTQIRSTIRIPLALYGLHIGDTIIFNSTTTDIAGQEFFSEEIKWIIVSPADSQWEPCLIACDEVYRRLQRTRSMTDELRRRWRDLDDNFRLDEVIAQRAALRIHDQHSRHIITELQSLVIACSQISSDFDPQIHQRLARIGKNIQFAHQLAESLISNRGAYILSRDKQTNTPALIRHSIDNCDDFDDLLAHIEKMCARLCAQLHYQNIINKISAISAQYTTVKKSLIADLAWSEGIYKKGLACKLYANTRLSGKSASQQQRPVFINNTQFPKVASIPSTDNFSLHWYGDVYIPTTGQWFIRAQSDDGIHCTIDSTEIFPGGWKNQAVHSYNAEQTLSVGWHTIHIRYYQASGDSRLRMWMGQNVKKLKDLNSMHLRSSAGSLHNSNVLSQMKSIGHPIGNQQYHTFVKIALSLYDFQDPLNENIRLMNDSKIQRLIDQCLNICRIQTARINTLTQQKPQIQTINGLSSDFSILSHKLKACIQVIDHHWRNELDAPSHPYTGLALDNFIAYAQHVLRSVSVYGNWNASYESFIRAHRLAERQHPLLWSFHNAAFQELRRLASDNRLSINARMQSLRLSDSIQTLGTSTLKDLDLHDKSSIWKLKALLVKLESAQRSTLPIRWDPALTYSQNLLARLKRKQSTEPQLTLLNTPTLFRTLRIQEMIHNIQMFSEHIGVEGLNLALLQHSQPSARTAEDIPFLPIHKILKLYAHTIEKLHALLTVKRVPFPVLKRLQECTGNDHNYSAHLRRELIHQSLLNAEHAAHAAHKKDLRHAQQYFFLALAITERGDRAPNKKWVSMLTAVLSDTPSANTVALLSDDNTPSPRYQKSINTYRDTHPSTGPTKSNPNHNTELDIFFKLSAVLAANSDLIPSDSKQKESAVDRQNTNDKNHPDRLNPARILIQNYATFVATIAATTTITETVETAETVETVETAEITISTQATTDTQLLPSSTQIQTQLRKLSDAQLNLNSLNSDSQHNLQNFLGSLTRTRTQLRHIIADGRKLIDPKNSTFGLPKNWRAYYTPLLSQIKEVHKSLELIPQNGSLIAYTDALNRLNKNILTKLALKSKERIASHLVIDARITTIARQLARLHADMKSSYTHFMNGIEDGIEHLCTHVELLSTYTTQLQLNLESDKERPTLKIDQLFKQIATNTTATCARGDSISQNLTHAHALIENISALTSLLQVLNSTQQIEALRCICKHQRILFEFFSQRSPNSLTTPYQNTILCMPLITSLKECQIVITELNTSIQSRLRMIPIRHNSGILQIRDHQHSLTHMLHQFQRRFQFLEDSLENDIDGLVPQSTLLLEQLRFDVFIHAIRYNSILDDNQTDESFVDNNLHIETQEDYISNSEKHQTDIESRFRSQRHEIQTLIQREGYYINKQYFSEDQKNIIDDYFTRLAEGN